MNTRGPNQNHQRRVDPNMYTNPNQYNHTPTATTNPRYLIGQQRPSHYQLSQATHNIADMKNNSHMPNMSHGQIQMVQHIQPRQTQLSHHIRSNAPRNLPRGPFQYQVYLPAAPYPNTNHATYFPYSPQQASQTVLMTAGPYMQNFPANQPPNSMFYSATPSRPIQVSNIQQGPPNPPVANMSNAQNTHGQSMIVQPQPMDIAANSQPLQVPQQSSATPIPDRPRRKAIKIIDPNTGNEVDINSAQQSAPSADELEKMKVQSQFQSQVQSAVKKDDVKIADNNQNSAGKEKVINEFQTQVKKLLSESTSPIKTDGVQEKIISSDTEEPLAAIESQNTELGKIEKTLNINLNSKDDTVKIVDKENSNSSLPNQTFENSISTELELPSQSSDVTSISEDSNSTKKLSAVDEESLKPVKSKKNKNKKKKGVEPQKNVTKDSTGNVVVSSSIKTVENLIEKPIENDSNLNDSNTIQNKENENENCLSKVEEEKTVKKNEEILPTQERKNNGVKNEVAEIVTPKLPSYIEKLPYTEDQWSLTNKSGKRVYTRAFLMQLCNETVCQKKPDVLRNWGNITRSANAPQYNVLGGGSSTGGTPISRSQSASATGFMPAYFKPGGSSQRGGMPMMSGAKRNSSQGKTASKSSKPNTIHMSLSLREEVKLNQTENAWVPTAVKKATKNDSSKNKNEDELKTEDVHKNVRSILNKITPDNKDALTESFKSLSIDTHDRLEKTIDLVFEKAIEEQSFAPLYASLCYAMQGLQVIYENGTKSTSFKKLIISKCQSLFELDKAQEMDSAKRLSEINSCKDSEKKKELQMEFEDNERRLRKRSVGNCRFIGELFKQKILTPNIMLYCIVNLVTKHDEEPLECLCNLLKTVGKELEQTYSLNETFDKLRALTSKEMKSKIPSRIRFMIQDVIDLRKDKWVPRRLDNKPKLINEIENDAKNEAIEQSIALSSYNSRPEKSQRDSHRDDKYRGGESKNRRNETEWNIVQNTKYKQQNYTIDQSKLQGLQGLKESSSVSLGPSSKWSFSSNSTGGKNSSFTSNNMYAPLNDDKKSSNSQLMSNKNTPRKPMISETEERQRMMSGVASMMPQFAQPSTTLNTSLTTSQTSKEAEESSSSNEELDPEIIDKINMQCKNIIQEYEQVHNIDDIIYSLKDDEKSAIRTRHEEFVKYVSLMTFEFSSKFQTEAGKMFAELLTKNVLSMTAITRGIDAVLKDWNDYLMDYPQFFSYIAAIIAPLLISKTASFNFINLKDACKSICPNDSCKFFIEVLQKILGSKETQDIKEQGGILWIYNKWRKSEQISLDVFVPNNKLNENFRNDRIGVFLLSIAMYDKMKFTDSKLLYDIMHSWISNNFKSEIIDCPQFVRSLTIANVIACLGPPNHSFDEFFDHVYIKLLTCYIRSKPLPVAEIQAREVQCLYGIQIMSAALEYPAGMVLKLFHKLYQDSVISKESFDLWKNDDVFKPGFDEDLETKTMAVVVLNSFFISLAVNDSDEEETIDP
ncbi:eukaryotic translation initiation factor 4 gamma 3-like isoform X2 [Daktulosphaira vitifoliae]|uniref:eukaryotic translation initiation factor 4 gamma 3-like isoform X2 n=1 Tax=Daktulosphaira vitifoliae TaxID=58002 RepID=UPI0021AAE167|nr:eukaryotic translation initiation factor 4 gamma 3-like isoform X2 [Daktulosphaira vitifoliae]